MKKKLLALFMILVLTMTAFVGCGKDDDEKEEAKADTSKSSFFKEMNEMSTLDLGSATVDVNFAIKGESLKSQATVKDFLDADGNLTGKLTLDVVCESETKYAVDISAKIGDKIDGKMATIAYDGQFIYAEYSALLDVVKDIAGEDTVSQIEQQVGTAIKVDYAQVSDLIMKAAESSNDSAAYMDLMTKMTKVATEKKDEAKELNASLFDALEKNFENITGTDDDMYTLTVSNDNIDTTIDDVAAFLNNDAEAIVLKYIDLFADVIEESGTSVEDTKTEVKEEISKAAKSVQDGKEEIVKQAADVDFEVALKANTDEGKGAKFSIETNDIDAGNGMTVGGSIDVDYTVGTKSISDKIPADANDLTTLIKMYLSNAK